jgi:hypothetical protein
MLLILLSVGIGVSQLLTPKHNQGKPLMMITSFLFDKEQKNTYELSMQSNMKLFAFDRSQLVHTQIEGVLNLNFIKKTPKKAIALMQLSKLSINTTDDRTDRALEHLYSQIFIVELAYDGKIIKSYFKGNQDDYKGLKQLLEMLQVVLVNKLKYVIEQPEEEGTLIMHYQRDANNTKHLYKQRTRQKNQNRAKAYKKIIKSDFDIKINEQWIQSLNIHEEIIVYAGKKKLIESRNHITLIQNNSLLDDTLAIWKYRDDINQMIQEYQNSPKESYFKQVEKNATIAYFTENKMTLQSLLDDLKENDLLQLNKIVKFITLYPDEAEKLYNAIRDADEDISSALINVLERSGTPQAQKVLRDIAQSEEFDYMNHLRAFIAMGGLAEPTDESIDFLWKMYEKRDTPTDKDLSNTSLLSLGILGPKSQKEEELQRKLKDEYILNSDDNFRKKIVLLSMQNANAENFKPEIFDALNDKSTLVKTAAIKALRKLDTDEVRVKMLQLFNINEAVEVRRKVIKTLLSIDTNAQLMQRARENLLTDSDNLVRKGIILYLLKNDTLYQENREVLQKFKYIEKDKENQILLIKNGF